MGQRSGSFAIAEQDEFDKAVQAVIYLYPTSRTAP